MRCGTDRAVRRACGSRWVFANAVGEAVGLGTTALIGAAIVSFLGEGTGTLATLTPAPGFTPCAGAHRARVGKVGRAEIVA